MKIKFTPDLGKKSTKRFHKKLGIQNAIYFIILLIVLTLILSVSILHHNRLVKFIDKSLMVTNPIPIDSIIEKEAIHYHTGHNYTFDIKDDSLDLKKHTQKFISKDTVEVVESYYGIDVSHWQNDIDWHRVSLDTIPKHISFAIIKATQGKNYIDPLFNKNWREAKKEKFILGAYHYFDPRVKPKDQALHFSATVKLQSGDFIPIVDIEEVCKECSTDAVKLRGFLSEFQVYLNEIEQIFHVKPIIYTYIGFYNHYIKNNFSGYPLWIAKYSHSPPEGFEKENDSSDYILWQFTSKGKINGVSTDVDFSYSNKDVQEYLIR